MAVLLKGLGEEGRVALTRAMRDSGQVMEWDLPGPVVDKHSTGGIGDCVSLVLAPALACLRGLCADDLGPRAWAIPAARWTSWRRFPAFAPACPKTHLRAQVAEIALRHRGGQRRSGARRQAALCASAM